MSYTAQKANRVLTIAEEKAEEYAKMGYIISNEAGETVIEPENLERKVAELKEKLEEARACILPEERRQPVSPLRRQIRRRKYAACTEG